jgi:hypothetical protein
MVALSRHYAWIDPRHTYQQTFAGRTMLDKRMRSSRNPFLRLPIRVYQSGRASPPDTLTTQTHRGSKRGAVGVAPRRCLAPPS